MDRCESKISDNCTGTAEFQLEDERKVCGACLRFNTGYLQAVPITPKFVCEEVRI